MIKIITAVGNEELNNILKKQKNIKIENPDIQYQEGIIEALEKYPDTNMIILSENIIGNFKIEELIQNIIIIKNNIKIILLCNEKIYKEDENLIKVIKYDEDYFDIILKIFSNEIEIKNKNEIQEIENYKNKLLEKNEYENFEEGLDKKINEEKNFDNKIIDEKIEKEIQELKNYKNNLKQKNINKKIKIKNRVNKNNILKRIKEIIKNIKEKLIKKQKKIITIIGCSGVRKNNFYFYII